jgi:hypothetical protein
MVTRSSIDAAGIENKEIIEKQRQILIEKTCNIV